MIRSAPAGLLRAVGGQAREIVVLHKTTPNNAEIGAPSTPCGICAGLADQEYACQKYGWEENNTHLPPAAGRLQTIRDIGPGGSRRLELQQCPECGAYYLYRTDYQYLANGTEDEEFLTRLSAGQAEEYI